MDPPPSPPKSADGFKAPSLRAPAAKAAPPPPPPPPLPYTPPDWSAAPRPGTWAFEVLKGGVIIDSFETKPNAPFLTVGRLPTCDIALEHPSISRYHAVLQYSDENHLFVYDMSTHGTSVNKKLVRPEHYHRLYDGDLVRFGGSSRLYIVKGPVDPAREQAMEAETHRRPSSPTRATSPTSPDTSGVTWGMHDDDDINDQEHPHEGGDGGPLPAAALKDPRKFLTQWLEARNLPLQFAHEQVSEPMSMFDARDKTRRRENAGAEITARVQISLDADDPSASAAITGTGTSTKKRDAERLAALDALQQLHAMGQLAESMGMSRIAAEKARMAALLGDDDDDGDADFLDRTQKPRASSPHTKKPPKAETYESLGAMRADAAARRAALDADIAAVEAKLTSASAAGNNEDEEDELDAFMSNLSRDQDKERHAALLEQRRALDAELARLDELIQIAAPSDLARAMAAKPRASAPRSPPPPPKSDSTPGVAVSKRPAPEPSDEDDSHQAPPPAKQRRRQGPAMPPPPAEADADADMDAEDKVVEWVPPANQRGDGRTALNDKLGY